MDKFIKDIETIVEQNFFTGDMSSLSCLLQGYKIGKSEVSHLLNDALTRYRNRHLQRDSQLNMVSSEQMRQINELVNYASDFWQMLPHDVCSPLSYNDYYRMGFINAVLRMMAILDIDEKRVKK